MSTEPCRLGYVEYDGFRYCHEHGEFVHEYDPHPFHCPASRLKTTALTAAHPTPNSTPVEGTP